MAGRDPLIERSVCDRACEWASLRLDDQLSPLEEELLERHLTACDECRAFEDDVRWATDVMRLTPAERPSRRVTMPAPSVRSRPLRRRRTAIAAAAAVALGAVVGSVVGEPRSTEPPASPSQVSLIDADDARDFPRTKIPVPAPAPPRNPPEGAI
jgi:ferric-dicitrate binding protein FerR (iron transport regulator)